MSVSAFLQILPMNDSSMNTTHPTSIIAHTNPHTQHIQVVVEILLLLSWRSLDTPERTMLSLQICTGCKWTRGVQADYCLSFHTNIGRVVTVLFQCFVPRSHPLWQLGFRDIPMNIVPIEGAANVGLDFRIYSGIPCCDNSWQYEDEPEITPHPSCTWTHHLAYADTASRPRFLSILRHWDCVHTTQA